MKLSNNTCSVPVLFRYPVRFQDYCLTTDTNGILHYHSKRAFTSITTYYSTLNGHSDSYSLVKQQNNTLRWNLLCWWQHLTYQSRFIRDAVLETAQYRQLSSRDNHVQREQQVLQVRRFVDLTGSTETQPVREWLKLRGEIRTLPSTMREQFRSNFLENSSALMDKLLVRVY